MASSHESKSESELEIDGSKGVVMRLVVVVWERGGVEMPDW